MKLLLRRSQSLTRLPEGLARFRRPVFKLWAMLEFEGDEQKLIDTYHFADTMLIEAIQPTLIRNTAIIGVGAFVVAYLLFSGAGFFGILLALAAGGGAGWIYFDRTRETIFVRDLLHGRYFDCKSVIALARKEAWLGVVTSYLRQVMESAKHWDGTEVREIEALSKEEAKLVAIRGL